MPSTKQAWHPAAQTPNCAGTYETRPLTRTITHHDHARQCSDRTATCGAPVVVVTARLDRFVRRGPSVVTLPRRVVKFT